MIEPTEPKNERQRQQAVDRYQILDTLPEACFDDITALMADISGAPIALITLLDNDRNYLKSHHGVPFSESPRNISFCAHAINSDDDIMVVEDASLDERFSDNPLVSEQGVSFYAGVPLKTPDGFKLGTLCLFDMKPHKLSDATKSILLKMARQTEFLLDLRLKNSLLMSTKNELESHNEELGKFARSISHDIKSPLTSLLYLTDSLIQETKDTDTDAIEESDLLHSLRKIKKSASSLAEYSDDLLEYYLNGDANRDNIEECHVDDIFKDIQLLFGSTDETSLTFSADCESINVNKASLNQILLNLISNAAKYSDKRHTNIAIVCKTVEDKIQFSVTDNGMGIPLGKLDDIFNLFETTGNIDKHGSIGTGIGLNTVKAVVTSLGGDIWVQSKMGEGSTFTFTLPNPTTQTVDISQIA